MKHNTKKNYRKILYYILFILMVLLGACTKPRTWTTPIEHHLFYEVQTTPFVKTKLKTNYKIQQDRVIITLKKQTYCKETQYDVRRVFLKKETKYPGKKYHIYLGGLISTLGIPSLYLGLFKATGTAAAIQLGIGVGIFLIPGAILLSQGIWETQNEKTSLQYIGKARSKVKENLYICGTKPAKNKKIEVLTKTGYVSIGATNEKGIIEFSINGLPKLSNKKEQYLEVWIKGKCALKIVFNEDNNASKNSNH